jgi:hypothetical protein
MSSTASVDPDGGGGGGKVWGWGRRGVGTGDTIFLGSTGGTESLAMLPMARFGFGEVAAIPIDNDECHDGQSTLMPTSNSRKAASLP